MRLVWRLLAIVGTFLAVGYGTMRVLIAHAVARGTPEYDVRLGGAMEACLLAVSPLCCWRCCYFWAVNHVRRP